MRINSGRSYTRRARFGLRLRDYLNVWHGRRLLYRSRWWNHLAVHHGEVAFRVFKSVVRQINDGRALAYHTLFVITAHVTRAAVQASYIERVAQARNIDHRNGYEQVKDD